jgi:5-methylcytosine-specific restriction endonuclease McrA
MDNENSFILNECETIISTKFDKFEFWGNAFLEIKQNKLYLNDYDTFQQYCNDRWKNIKFRRINDVMSNAGVVNNIANINHLSFLDKIEYLKTNEIYRKVKKLDSIKEKSYNKGKIRYEAKKKSILVKSLAGYICEVCGFSGKHFDILKVHHIIPISSSNSTECNDLENLTCLCPNCHDLVHYFQRNIDNEKNLNKIEHLNNEQILKLSFLIHKKLRIKTIK